MTYQEWAKEYFESAEKVQALIRKVQHQMKNAAADQLAELENKCRVLYGMYLDCIHTGNTLASRKGEC